MIHGGKRRIPLSIRYGDFQYPLIFVGAADWQLVGVHHRLLATHNYDDGEPRLGCSRTASARSLRGTASEAEKGKRHRDELEDRRCSRLHVHWPPQILTAEKASSSVSDVTLRF